MRDTVPSAGRQKLNKPRSRRNAAKTLGIALQTRYRKLLEADGDDAIVVATADLAQCMYENVEFVIWALKVQGGMSPPPPEALRKITPLKTPANDPRFAPPPKLEIAAPLPSGCTCPPMDMNLIGAARHMTSCPKFVP